MRIGKIKLDGRIFLAPMAGITDLPFRLLCQKYGAALCFTEMVNCRSLIEKSPSALELIKTVKGEKTGVQLFGSDPEEFKKAAKITKSKLIDINMGCPASKVIKTGAGSALLDNPRLIKEIVEAIKETKKTVTAKIRLGFSKINVIRNCKLLEKSGVDAITIHARTKNQGYRGKADWKYIKEAKKKVSVPIIGNGDINSGDKAKKMLNITDYCMIGRAAIGNPRIFREITYSMQGKKEKDILIEDQIKDFFEYVKLAQEHKTDNFVRIKEQSLYFTKGLKGARKLREKLSRAKNKKEIIDIFQNLIKN